MLEQRRERRAVYKAVHNSATNNHVAQKKRRLRRFKAFLVATLVVGDACKEPISEVGETLEDDCFTDKTILQLSVPAINV